MRLLWVAGTIIDIEIRKFLGAKVEVGETKSHSEEGLEEKLVD
jgi:hypothetical protein